MPVVLTKETVMEERRPFSARPLSFVQQVWMLRRIEKGGRAEEAGEGAALEGVPAAAYKWEAVEGARGLPFTAVYANRPHQRDWRGGRCGWWAGQGWQVRVQAGCACAGGRGLRVSGRSRW